MNSSSGKFYRSGAIFTALLLIFCSWYPPIQQLADEQVDAGLKRAVITFASARTINGLISVIQGTELSVQPLGVGVTLTPGQILDPINDLIEQFSTLMLFASVAFGVQKMLLAIGGHVVVSAVISVMAVLWALLTWVGRPHRWLTRLMLVLFMIRFAMPMATIGTDLVFRKIMADDYAASTMAMLATTRQIEILTPKPADGPTTPPAGESASPPGNAGLIDKMKKGIENFREGVSSRIPSIDLEAIRKAADELPEKIIKLIVIFLMQTLALPVLLIWAVYRIALGASSGWRAEGKG